MKLPEYTRSFVVQLHDELCEILTQWEQGEISDFELYDYMVKLDNKIQHIQYEETE